jgi:hypothetical protein
VVWSSCPLHLNRPQNLTIPPAPGVSHLCRCYVTPTETLPTETPRLMRRHHLLHRTTRPFVGLPGSHSNILMIRTCPPLGPTRPTRESQRKTWRPDQQSLVNRSFARRRGGGCM